MKPCVFHEEHPSGACPECSTDGCAATIYGPDIANEHRRMLIAFESIAKTATDMLDPVRRAGPSNEKDEVISNAQRELRSLCADGPTLTNVKEGLE